jgi:hypothetical protein
MVEDIVKPALDQEAAISEFATYLDILHTVDSEMMFCHWLGYSATPCWSSQSIGKMRWSCSVIRGLKIVDPGGLVYDSQGLQTIH